MRWPFIMRRERIRREAADWIARLNGPGGQSAREEFDHWYRSSADHADAYDRLSSLFEVAGTARRPAGASTVQSSGASQRPVRTLRYAFAAAAACAALLAFFILSARTTSPLPDARQQIAAFSSDGTADKRILLADGSEVLLSPGSALEVALGASERRLRLTRGQGRFSVAHDERPFIVAADGTEVRARGTQFVVSLAGGRTTVALIEGQVDVSYAPAPDRADRRRVARLRPGQQLVVESAARRGGAPVPAAPPADARPHGTSVAMLEFDETPLGQAVEQVNRHGRPQIRLGDPALGRLRITGAFRSGDTSGFAESVAAAFGLVVERGRDGALWLRSSREAAGAT